MTHIDISLVTGLWVISKWDVGKTMVKQLNKPTLYGNCGKTTYKYLW
jgi:hypothetical protein